MSLATIRGAGEGASERNRSRLRPHLPFLRRNVYRSQQILNKTMGSTISTLAGSMSMKSLEMPSHQSDGEDDDDSRPAKRRKTSILEPPTARRYPSESPRRKPLGHVTNGRVPSRLAGKLQAVQPAAFYGKSRSTTPAARPSTSTQQPSSRNGNNAAESIDSLLLPDTPLDFQRALQIEVLGIERRPDDGGETLDFLDNFESPLDVKCRCVVALFYEKSDGPTLQPGSKPESVELMREAQYCTLRTTLTEDHYITRELISLDPVLLTEEKIFVNRKLPGPLGTLLLSSELADKYTVMVFLEPVGPQKHWPPFDTHMEDSDPLAEVVKSNEITLRETYLQCTISKLLNPDHQDRAGDLKLCYRSKLRQQVPFRLRVQMKWSLPSKLSELSIRTPNSESTHSTKANNPAGEGIPPSPLAERGEDNSAANSPANARTHRRRSNIPTTYNLKHLSTIAQGRSPKPRKILRPRGLDSDGSSGINVTYCMGRADAADYAAKQQTTVNGLFCPFCSSYKSSLNELRVHLHSEHTSFKFSLRTSNPQKPKFFVELAKHGAWLNTAGSPDNERTFQMGQPKTLFNLEKYLNGDDSWVQRREGPINNSWPDHILKRRHESSSSPFDSRHSSPNTSIDTDGMMEYEGYQHKVAMRPRKVHYVPKTSKPLYHSITKQVLKPGDELPSSDDEKEEGWLHQKHRDIILDIGDVTADEKDYIVKWNPYIMDVQLTSEKYLPEAVMRFAEENKAWFLKKKSRKVEFGKHMETFVMRGVMTQECFSKAVDILRRSEKAAAETGEDINMDKEEKKSLSPAKQRGLLDCVCGEHTQPPDRVICRGRNCKGRYFHRSCAEESGRPIIGAWYCDHCVS